MSFGTNLSFGFGFGFGNNTTGSAPAIINLALPANGASATSSGDYSGTSASNALDGIRNGNFPNIVHSASGPPWTLDVDLGQSRTITEVDVIFYHGDNKPNPTLSTGFDSFTNPAFNLYYRNAGDTAWISLEAITGNDKVWRKFAYAPFTSRKIRFEVTGGVDLVRFQELEVWGY